MSARLGSVWAAVLYTVLGVIVLPTAVLGKDTTLTIILEGLERVKGLKPMENGKTHTLLASGKQVSALPDEFLRRRTADEILNSGVSCGCGDYAYAFYSLIEARKLTALYIDGVALTFNSIEGTDAGHTGVAVKDSESGNWILVDPTSGAIVSGDWNPEVKLYKCPLGTFWIGYCGPLEKYPIRDHAALRDFYASTLKTVPPDVWKQHLPTFEFAIDSSLKSGSDFRHPNLKAFLERPGRLCSKLGIQTGKVVKISLTLVNNADRSKQLSRGNDGTWTCRIREDDALSVRFTDWLVDHTLVD